MTSCFIHLFPSWLALTLRWWPIDTLRGGDGTSEPECTSGINSTDVWVSICLYLVWQVLYYIKTEHHEKVSFQRATVHSGSGSVARGSCGCLITALRAIRHWLEEAISVMAQSVLAWISQILQSANMMSPLGLYLCLEFLVAPSSATVL